MIQKYLFVFAFLIVSPLVYSQIKVSDVYGSAEIYANPDIQCHRYEKVLVISGHTNKESKWEENMVKKVTDQGFQAIGETSLFPPYKTYSEEERKNIYLKNGIDGIFRAEITDSRGAIDRNYNGLSRVNALGAKGRLYVRVTLFDVSANEDKISAMVKSNAYGQDSVERTVQRAFNLVVGNLNEKSLLCQ
jgi:hypothetical protein